MSWEDSFEHTELVIPKVFVFAIPKLQSSGGYRAGDWPKQAIWTGELKIVSIGNSKLAIKLEDPKDNNRLFASCQYTSPQVVEAVTDSSRYFVLRLKNANGRVAHVGIGFKERNLAFDFKAALMDHENTLKSIKNNKEQQAVPAAALKLGLQSGQTMSLNFGGASTSAVSSSSSTSSSSSSSVIPTLSAPMKLDMPGSGSNRTRSKKKKKKKKKTSDETKNNNNDNDGDGDVFAAMGGGDDPFGDVDNGGDDIFSSTDDPFASSSSSSTSNTDAIDPSWVSF